MPALRHDASCLNADMRMKSRAAQAPPPAVVVEEEVWENERWVLLKGWGSPGMMPQDLATGKRRFRHGGQGYDDFPGVSCPAGARSASPPWEALLMRALLTCCEPCWCWCYQGCRDASGI